MTVGVVGAGIVGASAALALVRRGHAVAVYDRFGLGHRRGSSHGPSRIVRKAYADPNFTEIAAAAHPLWEALDRDAGGGILHEVGVLYFGDADSPRIAEVADGLSRVSELYHVLEPREAKAVCPALRLERQEVGIFTPAAGWVHADRALAATIRLAEAAGAVFHWHHPVRADALPEADAVVVAAGPFVRDFAPDLPAIPTRQTVAYLPVESPGAVWIEDGPDHLYGFPTQDGTTKLAPHGPGTPIDPEDAPGEPETDHLALVADFARRRFGYDGPPAHTEVCRYTRLPEDRFAFTEIRPGVLVVSACSGHGFKFGPWVGGRIADWVEGEREFHEPWLHA